MNKISIVYTTIGSAEEAKELATKAVTKKYAACVNIVPGALSIYQWEGEVQQSSECLIIFKTDISRVDDLKELISKEHPYDVPAIIDCKAESSAKFHAFVIGGISV